MMAPSMRMTVLCLLQDAVMLCGDKFAYKASCTLCPTSPGMCAACVGSMHVDEANVLLDQSRGATEALLADYKGD